MKFDHCIDVLNRALNVHHSTIREAQNNPHLSDRLESTQALAQDLREGIARLKDKPMVYLAGPYTHSDRGVRERRFRAVTRVAADLIQKGVHVFSPISHSHPMVDLCGLRVDWEYWEAFDRFHLGQCHKMIVLKLDGWRQSRGVQAEIRIAEDLGIPVEYMAEKSAS